MYSSSDAGWQDCAVHSISPKTCACLFSRSRRRLTRAIPFLHRAAFVDYAVNKQPYIYDGSRALGDEVCDVIVMRPESNIKISYFFSRNTKRIVQTEIDFAGFKSRIEYGDYAEFGGGIFYPKSKTIYVNNKLFGNVVIDSVRFNQDVLFPR